MLIAGISSRHPFRLALIVPMVLGMSLIGWRVTSGDIDSGTYDRAEAMVYSAPKAILDGEPVYLPDIANQSKGRGWRFWKRT